MTIRQVEELAADVPLLADLEPPALALVAGCASTARFAAGEYVAREGAPADTFYAVREGLVALQLQAPARRDRDRDARPRTGRAAGRGCSLRTAGNSTCVPSSPCARWPSMPPACVARSNPTTRSATPSCAASRPSCSSACKPPVCDWSMSTATLPAEVPAGGTMVPRAYRVLCRSRDTADTWTLTLAPADGAVMAAYTSSTQRTRMLRNGLRQAAGVRPTSAAISRASGESRSPLSAKRAIGPTK